MEFYTNITLNHKNKKTETMKEIKEQTTGGMFGPDDIIHRYTRAQAIEDGVLADISQIAKEAGFKYPVAMSTGVYSLVNEAVEKGGKDYSGVIWDILTMLRYGISKAQPGENRINFQVLIYSKYINKDRLTDMYAVCGPGDTPDPVLTIMLPDED